MNPDILIPRSFSSPPRPRVRIQPDYLSHSEEIKLGQRYQALPRTCRAQNRLNLGNGEVWNADVVTLQYNKRIVFRGCAAAAPEFATMGNFWRLVSQFSGYLVCICPAFAPYYLTEDRELALQDTPEVIIRERGDLSEEPCGDMTLSHRSVSIPQGTTTTVVPALEIANFSGLLAVKTKVLARLVDEIYPWTSRLDHPGVIHCHYGKGRTAVLMVGCALRALSEEGLLTRENLADVIDDLITQGRMSRHAEFVEKEAQYLSLVRLGLLYLHEKGINDPAQSASAPSLSVKRRSPPQAEPSPKRAEPSRY